jgi:TRAP-type C4-dicarboxylate transport system substrate-binding protein
MKKCFYLFASIFLFFALSPAAFAAPVVKWDLPLMSVPGFYITKDLEFFVDALSKKTNGNFQIILHPGSSLLKQNQLAPGVISGRVPIAPVGDFNVYDIMPKLGVLFLPFFTSSTDQFQRGGDALRETFYQMLDEKGLKPLFTWTWPPNHLHSKQSMGTIDSWKGRKIRIYNSEQTKVCNKLNAAPTQVAFSEVYNAVQRGTVDAFITSNPNIPVMKLYEVAKFANQWTVHGGGIDYLSVNKKAWAELPAEYQKALLDLIKETKIEARMWNSAREADNRSIQEMKEKGVTVVYPSAADLKKARDISESVWDEWAKTNNAEELLKKAKEIVHR